MLTFDEEKHLYAHDGNPIPSVTQILGQFLKVGNVYIDVFTGATIPADVFEAAGVWGTAVHKMLHYYLDNDLDFDSLSDEMRNTLENRFWRWADDYKVEVISHEEKLYSKKYGFAGTYDLKCKIKGKTWLVDYKTGAYGMAGPQLAAYIQLDKENYKGGMRHRAVLHLPKSGDGYKFIPQTGLSDWSFFMARLNTYNFTRRA